MFEKRIKQEILVRIYNVHFLSRALTCMVRLMVSINYKFNNTAIMSAHIFHWQTVQPCLSDTSTSFIQLTHWSVLMYNNYSQCLHEKFDGPPPYKIFVSGSNHSVVIPIKQSKYTAYFVQQTCFIFYKNIFIRSFLKAPLLEIF